MDDSFYTKKLKYTTLKKTIQYDSSLINYGTIDSLHSKFILEFEKQDKSISKILLKIDKFKKELSVLEIKSPNEYTINDISKKADIKDKIEILNESIDRISSANDELDYFTRSLPILTQYYGINRNVTLLEENNKINIDNKKRR